MQTQIFRYRVRLTLLAVLSVAMTVAGGGCTNIVDEVKNRQSRPSKPLPSPPRGEFLDEAPGGTPIQSNRAAPNANQNRIPAATSNAPPIHLSAGVALAQTFPSGTGMSFSVDYQFRQGGPNASNRYVWVIEGQSGKPLERPVKLSADGNLPLIVPGLRPEAGPFSSHIVEITPDGSRQKVSRSVPMR